MNINLNYRICENEDYCIPNPDPEKTKVISYILEIKIVF